VEGTRGRGGGEVHEKLDMLTLHCLCRVVGLRQLGSHHVVRNGRFQGHSMCMLYSKEESGTRIMPPVHLQWGGSAQLS